MQNLNVSLGELCVHYRKSDRDRTKTSALVTYLEGTV